MTRQLTHRNIHIHTRQSGSIKRNLLTILLAATGVLAFAWLMLPEGYHSDTTLIGKGRPAIVLVYDANNAVSDHLIESFNHVRDEFKAEVEFILVDMSAPGGAQFANANAATTASALFFDSKGQRISTLYSPQEADALGSIIRRVFGL